MKKAIIITCIIAIIGIWGYFLYTNIFALTSESEVAEITKNLPSPTTFVIPTDQPTPTSSQSADTDQIKQAFANKHGKPVTDLNLKVAENNGLFAHGTISFVGDNGGAWWLAAKVKGVWVAVQDGNGYVPCNSVVDYNFPKSMIPECVDSKGKLIIL